MREKALGLLGLMRRANAIAVGEVNTGAAAKSGKVKLLLLAADASDNARKRAAGFAAHRGFPTVTLPFAKDEISARLGVSGCAMAAVTDLGFAEALLQLLSAQWPESCAEAARELAERRERTQRRSAALSDKRTGKRRTNR